MADAINPFHFNAASWPLANRRYAALLVSLRQESQRFGIIKAAAARFKGMAL
jgi:hypothetical protein